MRIIFTFVLVLFCAGSSFGQSEFYVKSWSRVYKYELQALPKSALLAVDSIYSRAKREKNIPQLTKALIYQSKFALTLNENPELLITQKIQREVNQAETPLRNILESILANIYWDYFQQNRYTYYDRSHTEKRVGDDFRLWDASSILSEIHLHYQNSLRHPELLQKISLATINELLIQAEGSKTYRPTLYDFLAHNALDFYETNERELMRTTSEFVFNDPQYFSDFKRVTFSAQDSASSAYQTLRIFRWLLSFHEADLDPGAFIQNELERLQFIVNKGDFDNASELHKEALKKLSTLYQKYPASTLIDFELASMLNREGSEFDFKTKQANQFKKDEALKICERAIATFPKSEGALQCIALRAEILHQKLQLETERYIPADKPARLLVSYTNVDSLLFFAYAVSPEFEKEFSAVNGDSLRWATMAGLTPAAQWKATLPNLHDHQAHTTEVVIPGLKNGYYLIAAYPVSKSISSFRDLFAYEFIQVTDLSMVEASFENEVRYQVVNRVNGRPLEGASVHFQSNAQNAGYDSLDKTFITDKNGFFEFKRSQKNYYRLQATVEYKGDRATFGDYYLYQANERLEKETSVTAKAFLFTDRSIYRPGQTVFFKGILIQRKGKKSSVVSGQYVKVSLNDVNYAEVGALRLKTNSYGSFSGEFKLPANCLTGEFILAVDEDDEDESRFYDNLEDFEESELEISVEEYKRPTFEVLFKPVSETYVLNDSVKVRGSALAFSGAKVGDAKVSYHVKRNVRYPQWSGWGRSYSYSNEEELEDGETKSDGEGEFVVVFKALPDANVAKDEQPIFEFEITAEVTDINGETRNGLTTVRIAYQRAIANITSAPSFNRQAENVITVSVENMSGQPVPSTGTLSIYKIKSPKHPQRPRPWPAPDLQQFSEEEFLKLFPSDPYRSEAESKRPVPGKKMAQYNFNTALTGEVKFKVDKSWELGSYYAALFTTDAKGDSVVAFRKFDLIDPKVNQVPDQKVLVVEADKPVYQVGDVAKVKIGSASKDITVVIYLEKNNKIVKSWVRHLSGNYTDIQVPITEGNNSNVLIHYSAVNFNSFFSGRNKIIVDESKRKMEIETISFKDKLQPGAKETWSFEIKGSDPLKKEAEVVASMYDASLDQFKNHAWTFEPIEREYYYSSTRIGADRSFGTGNFVVRNRASSFFQSPSLYFDRFDDFGFSITGLKSITDRYLNRIYTNENSSVSTSKVKESNNRKIKKGYVTGIVTSEEDGAPIPGVNVLIKGTTEGTVTDLEGRYLLQADRGDQLVFSFIGYSTIETTIGRKNTLDVVLGQDVKQLSEVVVTALGVSQDKKTLGYSVSNVVEGYLHGDVDLNYTLAGRVAGVQITGLPGGAAQLRIRGASSVSENSNPLYVVDGVIVEESKIDKDDLESVQVLKGEAATAIYGSQGENGVIIITTKSGQKKLDEELAKVNARKNFNETAFFFPHLTTDENGRIQFTFTTPESLTRWKIQVMAHNRELESSLKTLNAVTQKDFMVTPNAPRFLRIGDEIIFSAKINSLTGSDLFGNASLQLTNAVTGEPVDKLFENQVRNQPFKVKAKGNTQVSWKLKIPSGIDAVQYKVVAKAGDFSDGEQNALPLLSNRILVTETLPMSIRAGQTKTFALDKLKNNSSTSIQQHQLILEITSNPAWYAVQALPYLMEFPHECSEQTFARYYANILASHIANSSPRIKEVFDKWASSGALLSNLEKNTELKSILLQETPWVRDAQNETEQKKRMALLFDLNTMTNQMETALTKLQQLQLTDGGFTWFAGGRYSSRYITQHIASGFGHLKTLKIVSEKNALHSNIIKAVAFLDNEVVSDYNRLLEQANRLKTNAKSLQEGEQLVKDFLEQQHTWNEQIHYLYMRSFYDDVKIPEAALAAVDYYKRQSVLYWRNFNVYLKGMIALIHHRAGNSEFAVKVLKSLKESSIANEEMGMYWKENSGGWYWYEAPVETQALLIEAFNEIEQNKAERDKTLDDLRIWLLKNKQNNQWPTTKATSEAVYALLLSGTEWLTLSDNVEVSVGGKKVTPAPQSIEAGTGYFKTTWKGKFITPTMGDVKLTKKGEGIAWAGLYWQYFEDLDKITAAETPLKLSKKVYMVTRENKKELLMEIDPYKPISVGSLIRIRIELKADRDMEFLHLKDMRASGLEPVDVLSAYKWQEDLGYYQSTKDASTNFFFDFVPKGVYVFEYDLRASNKGNFGNGIATIQSMYAPEFGAHSEAIRVKIE